MFGLGTQELIIVLVIVLFFFGAKKLPELARGLGSGAKEFKRGLAEGVPAEKGKAAVSAGTDRKEET